MVNYFFVLGIMAGVGGIAAIASLVPQSDSISTGLCTVEINGTVQKTCSKIHDSLNINSTRQLAFSYDTRTQTFGFNVMTNSTKFSWSVVDDIAPIAWTAQPATATELLGITNLRTQVDLTGYKQVRILGVITTVGNTGATLEPQYSTDCSTWLSLGVTNPSIALDATGLKISSWQTLAPNAKGDVCLRIVGTGGNGALNPAFNSLNLQFR